MKLFEIKSYFSGGLLFSLLTNSLKLCVEAAVKSGAELAGILSAPVATKMFYRDNNETLQWLTDREYAKATT